MRSLLYRFPRFRAEFPMDFILGESVILGVCVNISESGLRGTLSYPVPDGSKGLLNLYYRDHTVQIHAQVESMKADEARIRFEFASEQEHQDLEDFIKLLLPPPASKR